VKQIVTMLIILGVVIALCFSVVFPIGGQVKDVGGKAFNSVKTLNNNISN